MITQILLIVNMAIFSVFNIVLGKITCGEPWAVVCVNESFLYSFAQVNHLVMSGERIYQLFTSMFVHLFFLHLLWNMLSLWYFGVKLERRSGSLTFLCIYLSSGIVANIFSLALGPAVVAGASGAVFGVVGAYMLLIVRNGRIAIPVITFLVMIHAPLLLGAKINVLGHAIGLITGITLALIPKLCRRGFLLRVTIRANATIAAIPASRYGSVLPDNTNSPSLGSINV